MDLYTHEDSQELLQSLDRALPYIEYALKNNKPMFEGERYLTSEELLFYSQKSAVGLCSIIGVMAFSLLFNFRAKCCFVNRILGKYWKIDFVLPII